MFINALILDNQTGKPIPYASVELTDQTGLYLGVGAAANSQGRFSLDSPITQPGTYLRVSHAAYSPISVSYPDYIGKQTYRLNQLSVDLDEVIITGKKTAMGNNDVIVWVGAAVLGFFLLTKKT